MADPFVTETIARFTELARRVGDPAAIEQALFDRVDQVRREAQAKGVRLEEIVRGLERLAHEAEVPPPDRREVLEQGASMRFAGTLRRAADLLRGPEPDLTPHKPLSGGTATPGG